MVTDYLDAILGEGTYHNTRKGAQYSYKCPLCNDYKERLFVNVDNGKFMCHHCSTAGTNVTLLSLINNITWKEALSIYREYQGYEVQLPDSIESEVYDRLINNVGDSGIIMPKFVYPLPDEFILIEEAKGSTGRKALNYIKSRGISIDTCIQQYVGYCEEGDYANRIIMPDFEGGELVYWQARTWEPKPKNKLVAKFYRKVLNPSLSKEQIAEGIIAVDKSEVVSNIDLILENGVAVICEGRFDSYTIGDSGACIHGKHLSDEQFVKLVKNKDKISTAIVMLDGDAFDKTLSTAKRLAGYLSDVWVTKLPDNMDPNSLGKRGVAKAINDAIPYTPLVEAKARIRGWI